MRVDPRHTLSLEGGTYGGWVLGKHKARRPAPRALRRRSPNPLVRLDRQVDLRTLPILMVLMW